MEKTLDRIQRDYYWAGMSADIRDFVRSCLLCQQYKRTQRGQQGLMNRKFIDAPWLIISADVIEFTTSRHGFKYLLMIQELFTKWVELPPMRNANGKTIARAIEDLVLFRWETLEFVLSDNGAEFDNKVVNDLIKEYGMRQINVLLYDAQSNPTEWVNRTLKLIITIFVEKTTKLEIYICLNLDSPSTPRSPKQPKCPQHF